jgi:translation initiation factor IF-2
VKVKTFRLIYDLLAYLEKRVLNLQQPTRPEVLGRAEIIAQFEIKGERILGAKVVEGELRKEARLHWQRAEKILDEVKFKSLKKGKLDVLAVKKGEEFGAVLAPVVDFQVGDLLVYFRDGSN